METLQTIPGNIWLDYHHYQCMGSEAGKVKEHLEAAEFQELLVEKMQHFPVIIGEFSLALQPSAEGYGDGTSWPKRFFQRQTSLAEKHAPRFSWFLGVSRVGTEAAAWFFWNYKIARDGWPHWSVSARGVGLLPLR